MTETQERTKTERFLPYPYAKLGLDFALTAVTVDGIDRLASADAQARLIALEDRRPEKVELEVEVQLANTVLAQLVPEEELVEPPLSLFIAIRCAPTRLRRSVVLSGAPLRDRDFSAKIALSIDDVRGTVELIPFLVRASSGASRRHARHAGARLASARPWLVRFDVSRPPQGRFLDVRYEPFSKFPDAPLWAGALYRLEHDQEIPILWLNADHRELVGILDNKATRGPAARMREVFFAHIAHGVWTQLFLTAAEAVASDEPGGEYGWCDSVLRRFLPSIFREYSDHRSRVEELADHVRRGALRDLVRELDRALQDDLRAVDHMKSLIEEKGV